MACCYGDGGGSGLVAGCYGDGGGSGPVIPSIQFT